jgi:hypothetical protein
VVLVSARADEVEQAAIGRGPLGDETRDIHLAERRRNAVERLCLQRRGDLIKERINRGRADDREHVRDVVGGVRNERHGGVLLGFLEELLVLAGA